MNVYSAGKKISKGKLKIRMLQQIQMLDQSLDRCQNIFCSDKEIYLRQFFQKYPLHCGSRRPFAIISGI